MFKTHIKRVAFAAVLGALGAFAYMQVAPKVFQAETQLMIAEQPTAQKTESPDAASLSVALVQDTTSEMQLLASEQMFDQGLLRASVVIRLESAGTPPDKKTVDSEVSDLTHNANRASEVQSVFDKYDEPRLYAMYSQMTNRGSRDADLMVKANDPHLAKLIADGISDAYNALRMEKGRTGIRDAIATFETQVKGAKDTLDASENSLRAFREKNNVVSLDEKAAEVARYEGALVQQLDSAKLEEAQLKRTVTAQRAKLSLQPQYMIEGYSEPANPLITRWKDQMATYETQRTEALRTYTPDSKKVREIDHLIDQMRRNLAQEQTKQYDKGGRNLATNPLWRDLQTQQVQGQVGLAGAQSRISSLTGALAATRAQIGTLPKLEVALAELTRDREIALQKYQRMKSQLTDLTLRQDAIIKQAEVMFPAFAPLRPVSPDAFKVGLVGIIGGICAGVLFSFVREALRANVRTSTELADLLALPVSATAPALPGRAARARLASLPSPQFKPLESYRYMASAMLFSNGSRPNRVLFTSAGGAVGCTTSAGEFAVAAAKMGLKVILVDADLRHGTLSRAFRVSDKSGVREVINRTLLPSAGTDLYLETDHPNLYIMPAGSDEGEGISDVPVTHLKGFLDTLQEHADMVIIDSPPCDVVADASRFVPMVDEVCLVVSARDTNYRIIPIASELLKRAGAHKLSLILTGSNPQEEAFSRLSTYSVTRR